jgi:hypothetical protein
LVDQLKNAIDEFKKTFDTSTGTALGQVDHPEKAMDEGEEGQEKVTAHRKPPEPKGQA